MQQKSIILITTSKEDKISTNFQNWELYCNKSEKKTKIGKDHENEAPKPPYSTIKSHSQSTTNVDTTVDDIDFTQLEES